MNKRLSAHALSFAQTTLHLVRNKLSKSSTVYIVFIYSAKQETFLANDCKHVSYFSYGYLH